MKFSLLLVFVICLQLKVANTNQKSGQKAQNEKNFTIYSFRNTKRNQIKQAHSQFCLQISLLCSSQSLKSETPFINPMSKVSRPVWTKESP